MPSDKKNGLADFGSRVRFVMEREGIDEAASFARLIGTSKQNVANWLTREKPTTKGVETISAALSWINPNWLLTGEGLVVASTSSNKIDEPTPYTRFLQQQGDAEESRSSSPQPQPDTPQTARSAANGTAQPVAPTAGVSAAGDDVVSARIVTLEVRRYDGVRASAGHGAENDEDYGGDGALQPDVYYIDIIEVEDLIGKGTKPTQAFAIIIEGDSMYPELMPGERVVIEPIERVRNDGIHLFSIGDNVFVKRLQRLPDGSFEATSINEDYRPFIIGPEYADQFRVYGRLYGKYKRYN